MAGCKRPAEVLLFAGDNVDDEVRFVVQLGVPVPEQIDGGLREAGCNEPLAPEPPGVTDGTTQHAPEDVAATVVARDDAVGDQNRHRSAVIGEDPQAHIVHRVTAVLDAGEALSHFEHGPEGVDLEPRPHALEDHGEPLEPETGVDVLRRQVPDDVVRLVLDVLHEHEVPDLDEALFATTDRTAVLAVLGAAIVEDLR